MLNAMHAAGWQKRHYTTDDTRKFILNNHYSVITPISFLILDSPDKLSYISHWTLKFYKADHKN